MTVREAIPTSFSGDALRRFVAHSHSRQQRGFTLVELLIVACIIGILLALALPLLGMVQRSARTVQCMNNQRQTHVALFAFAGEHKDRLPSSGSPGWSTQVQLATGETRGTSHLVDQGYLPTTRVFVCPQSNSVRAQLVVGFRQVMGIDWAYHYAANLGYVGTDRYSGDWVMGTYYWTGKPTARLRTSESNASKTVLTCDRVMFVNYTDTYTLNGQMQVTASAPHHGAVIASYVDGRGAAVRANNLRSSWVGDEGGIPSYADWTNGVSTGE